VDNSAALWVTFVGWALQALHGLIDTAEAVSGRETAVVNAPKSKGQLCWQTPLPFAGNCQQSP
jgi:hypothetical protein